MRQPVKIAFEGFEGANEGTLVVFAGEGSILAPEAHAAVGGDDSALRRAAEHEAFKGRAMSSLTLLAPQGLAAAKVLLLGVAPDEKNPLDMANLGGAAAGQIGPKNATVVFAFPDPVLASADNAAEFALGVQLRSYSFDKYKTKKPEGEPAEEKSRTVTIRVADPQAARKAFRARQAVAEGVNLARDLVNEPPNVLFPEEFADRAAALEKLGVEVEVLDEKALRKLGMRTLLAVGQGSRRESRVVIMRWNGAKDEKAAPLAFVGKGVCFDTGGISIKPAGGMEDMKGDMAGAACVVGLMHALASRKARINAVGAIGLVENMPDGNAQRPGDIVTSMSGQTIEIINTDAEGPPRAG